MIHLIKLYTCLLIVVYAAKFIDASCLSYGHSCWGAHGKRSYVPQKNNDINMNRWALFRFNEKNDIYPLKKIMRENSFQRYADNEASMNMPNINQQFPLYDDDNERNSVRNYADLADESAEREILQKQQQQQQPPRAAEEFKPYRAMRLNKQMSSNTQ